MFIGGKLDSGIVAIAFTFPGEFGHVILLISVKTRTAFLRGRDEATSTDPMICELSVGVKGFVS
jgi:hypothetical protein